ncbi:MAG: zinc-ribbon domain-containing protein [Deltaproteobacteria bacterium]|nr:zinc-ribbon domain-containing protein [Deltaproteobacteria bacterium]
MLARTDEMIVQCDSCKTKFRLDDSKIGARGLKVRCSRCAHVFHVRHAEMPSEGELRPPTMPPELVLPLPTVLPPGSALSHGSGRPQVSDLVLDLGDARPPVAGTWAPFDDAFSAPPFASPSFPPLLGEPGLSFDLEADPPHRFDTLRSSPPIPALPRRGPPPPPPVSAVFQSPPERRTPTPPPWGADFPAFADHPHNEQTERSLPSAPPPLPSFPPEPFVPSHALEPPTLTGPPPVAPAVGAPSLRSSFDYADPLDGGRSESLPPPPIDRDPFVEPATDQLFREMTAVPIEDPFGPDGPDDNSEPEIVQGPSLGHDGLTGESNAPSRVRSSTGKIDLQQGLLGHAGTPRATSLTNDAETRIAPLSEAPPGGLPRTPARTALFFGATALLAAVFIALGAARGSWLTTALGMQRAPLTPGALSGVLPERAIATSYTSSAGPMLVVTGLASNRTDRVLDDLEVIASVLDGDRVVVQETALLGAVVALDRLAAARRAEDLREALPDAAVSLPPGETRPFMVIFPQLPPEMERLSVLVEFRRRSGGPETRRGVARFEPTMLAFQAPWD